MFDLSAILRMLTVSVGALTISREGGDLDASSSLIAQFVGQASRDFGSSRKTGWIPASKSPFLVDI